MQPATTSKRATLPVLFVTRHWVCSTFRYFTPWLNKISGSFSSWTSYDHRRLPTWIVWSCWLSSDRLFQLSAVFTWLSVILRSGNSEMFDWDIVHRSLSGISPSYLLVCRGSTENRTCVVTWTYRTFRDRAFAAAGPGLWNSLTSSMNQ